MKNKPRSSGRGSSSPPKGKSSSPVSSKKKAYDGNAYDKKSRAGAREEKSFKSDRPAAKEGYKGSKPFAAKEERSFNSNSSPRRSNAFKGDTGYRSSQDKNYKGEAKDSFEGKKSFRPGEDKPFRKEYGTGRSEGFEAKKSYKPREDKPFRTERPAGKTDGFAPKRAYKPREDKDFAPKKEEGFRKSDNPRSKALGANKRKDAEQATFQPKTYVEPKFIKKNERRARENEEEGFNELSKMRLNRYIAHCGVVSRRKADEIIKEGRIKVNGKVVSEPGTLWSKGMSVTLDGKRLEPQEQVYILMNKSKNVITSTADEHDRLTVVEILTPALERMGLGHLRIFPVGRLDRNTTGVILLTNDGELTQELTHPSREIEKIYQVRLNKPVTSEHMSMLADGIELEDGMIHCDQVAYVHELTKDEVGVQIHSGRNRIVRRMFEHLGYEVTKLDRVSFSGLTKKDLPRGKWRILKPDEVRRLKYFNKTKTTTKDKK